jgi:predicted aspartyl protease
MYVLTRKVLTTVIILISMLVLHVSPLLAKPIPEISVPFTWSSTGHVMVDAVVNDTWKVSLAVDTGAQFGVLPEMAIQELDIGPNDISIQHALTATDMRQLRHTQVSSVTVGGYKIRNLSVLLLDLANVIERVDLPIGVLPVRFISKFNVYFDLANQRLDFYNRKTEISEYLNLENYSEVNYQAVYGFIKFPIEINDRLIHAVLDTGASGNPIINWQAANMLGVDKDNLKLEEGRDIQGAGVHKHKTQQYVFDSLRIGGINLPATRMDIFDMPHLKQLLGTGPAANVGLSRLGLESILVDYENQRLFLRT